MGIFDIFTKGLQTKEPSFRITTNREWNDYTPLIHSNKYLDQYFGWLYIGINKWRVS